MEQIAGRTVFVTGGARGIGLAMARAFGAEGAKVAIADVDPAALAAARASLAATTDVAAYELDVRDREAFARVADQAEDRLGPVSVLCNNAGVGVFVPPSAMSYALWDFVVGVNLGGVVNGIQTFLPRMLARPGAGHIVNTASGAGLVANEGYLYATAKFGVVGLSESLRQQREFLAHPIGVTVLCPGLVRTGIAGNSQALQPVPDLTDEQRKAVTDRSTMAASAIEEYGLDPDQVAAMVVAAVRADQLYVHTDRMMLEPITARTQQLLAAMPLETERDREFTVEP